MLIRHLSYFITLARERHYARAAEACNITQPTLSSAIRKLEEDLQVQLVARGHRFVGLTPDGEKVLAWGRRILDDYTSLREDMGAARHGVTGTLRLGVIPAATPAVAFLTARLAASQPALCVDIRSLSSRAIQHGMDAFELDAGITYLENEPLERVRKVPLYREHYVFATRRGNRHAERKTITWAEAAEEKLCLLTPDMQNRRILDRIARSAGVTLSAPVTGDSFVALHAHLIQGEWSSILPHTFASVLAHPELVMLPLTGPEASQNIGLVLPERDPLSPICAAILSVALKSHLESDFSLSP